MIKIIYLLAFTCLHAGIGIGISSDQPVPVTLISFDAILERDIVTLNWTTATEVNNYGFEIERSEDLYEWQKIGFIPGYGNSNSTKEYTFIDNLTGIITDSVEYRLKQIDTNGKFKYSDVIGINNNPAVFALYQNYPNPFNKLTTISYSIPIMSHVTIQIFDILGRLVSTIIDEKQKPSNYKIIFNTPRISSGVYFYRMQTENYISIKKMILVK